MGWPVSALRQECSTWRTSGNHVTVRCCCSVECCQGSWCSEILPQTHDSGQRGSLGRRNNIQRCATTDLVTFPPATRSRNLSGGDMHISAQFSDANCTIKASLFFDSLNCIPNLTAGITYQLVGIEMQQWNGCIQLSGKNVLIVPIHT